MTRAMMAQALKILEQVIDEDRQNVLLDKLCAGNLKLAQLVRKLLEDDKVAEQSGFLATPIELNIGWLDEGTIIADRFHLVRHIGCGGGGRVYEAEDKSLGHAPVALKILHQIMADTNSRAIERFLNESSLVAKLAHPNVVPVLSAGEDNGLYYYAMQLIPGEDLEKRIARWKENELLSSEARIREVAEFGLQAARGLNHAHEMGLIHRDIKPGNLLIDGENNLWITDFGLARLREHQADVTATVGLCGTLWYMSPEQFSRGQLPIDVHTDTYSLGVTLYEMLALRRPFEGTDLVELSRAIVEDEPPRLRIINPHVPIALESIVRKAMAKSPTSRYRSANEFAADLQRFRNGEPVEIPGDDAEAAKAEVRQRVLAVTESAIEMLDRWALLEPSLNEIQQNLLAAALKSVVNLSESETDDHWRLKIADACRRVGEVQRRLGQFDEAQSALETAVKILTDLISENRHDVRRAQMLARTLITQGILLSDLDDVETAKRTLEECVVLCEQPLLQRPEEANINSWYEPAIAAHLNLGVLFEGRDEGLEHFRAAVTLSRKFEGLSSQSDATPKLWLALSLYRSGLHLEISGRDDEADGSYKEVFEVAEQLGTTVSRPGWGRLLSLRLLSEFSTRIHFESSIIRKPQREPLYQWSIQVMQDLSEHEFVPEYRLYLGVRQLAYGHLLKTLGRLEEAEGRFHEVVQTYKELIDDFGELPEYCENLAAGKSFLGEVHYAAGRKRDAISYWDEAIDLLEQLTRRFPRIRRYQDDLEWDRERRAEALSDRDGDADSVSC